MRISPRGLFWLKVLLHISFLLPAFYLVTLVLTDNAGGDPVQYIIHYTGMGAINSLLATLLISPIAKRFKIAALMQTRRLVGLYVCAYALLHISAFISLDLLFAWGLLFEEVIKRPYILVGAATLIIIVSLALTSPNAIKRRLGKRWQSLHNWVYLAAILAPIHFYWSVKSEIIEPSIYIVLFAALLVYRKDSIYKWLKPNK
ncbi:MULTISPECIES: protein-methionine-sulfoxide reductase heme-binding subunit MsrQ [Shewanella]|jgi:sulfoxide reductase heme-binding subunit YedZ|uniref:Protein-methionine-sulfoxide reductase heme-binding subunit MsrQ n=1 Tax=Shewanella psychromarinicola TaxID=2487742 RepID=A0A3N4DCF2_9GAMM|nr:protein-methionine-sulfoxide reductase heme-binding subunit MsrQ [Shewanella psychromarinicola]AZG35761.1 protein-methionine-sulfoxide reductase heme-binding subunit MsrQ [Shewanella psychromarinicola]MCL1083944.1 protein-methionine-sulfoxide reductase heme-binding subunit MsrQ [Shewanella psychromarinicola]RPA22652.1 protein-methionine-sulfoxide reductase heme-binding subunit MsrQ [Shewanella psychromarinicola]|tara:strand:+ start:147244 stop:147849 length:606 start_codon:yes stop_codon:yes gene_type:complete